MNISIPWSSLERRWRDELFARVLPADAGLPGFEHAAVSGFWEAFDGSAPPTVRVALRVAVWALTWAPLLRLRPVRLGRLPAPEADRLLAAVANSPNPVVRPLAEVVRLVACMAYLRDPAVRAAVDPGLG